MDGKTKKPVQNRNVRALALQVIMETLEKGQYCDHVLHQVLAEHRDLSRQDRAFLTRLAEGTVERCLELDYWINQYSNVPVNKMKPVIRCIMRMAVYQFRYMDQVPNRAACDEAVKLVVKRRMHGLRGFVNGVLRNMERHLGEMTEPDRGSFVSYASVKYSMPEWIVQYFLREYPQDLVDTMLQSYLDRDHTLCVRCNIFLGSSENGAEGSDIESPQSRTGQSDIKSTESRTGRFDTKSLEEGIEEARIQTVKASLQKQGVEIQDGYLYRDAFLLKGYDRLDQLEAFRQGMIQVQAESSMVVGKVSGIRPGQTVMDVCAAPGGKTIHAADILQGQGRLISCDISDKKIQLIQENLQRTNAEQVELYSQDARILRKEWIGTIDVLIADLPCSGLGVLGNKCDIKYHTEWEDVQALARLQREILQVVSQYVKPGGVLLYSTCTIGSEENQKNAQWISSHLPFCFESMEDSLPEPLRGRTGTEGYLQILPTDHTDGFFIAKFRRSMEVSKDGENRY